MNNLAQAIDNLDTDALEDLCRAWLKAKNTTLWQTFDLSEQLDEAAEWLAHILVSIDTFGLHEYRWEEDENDDEDRVRPSGAGREDSEVDPWDARIQWR